MIKKIISVYLAIGLGAALADGDLQQTLKSSFDSFDIAMNLCKDESGEIDRSVEITKILTKFVTTVGVGAMYAVLWPLCVKEVVR